MAWRRYALALAAGTLLSGIAAGLLGSLGPSAPFPSLSWHHPLAGYRALAGAPFGSAMELFLLTAVTCFACFLAAGLLDRRRARASQPAAPVPERDQREEAFQ